jgi:hypothetical protein
VGFFIFYKILIFINKIILTNQTLLIEDLKRIGFMMNYEPGKLVTENEKTSKNVIVENKIETLFTPKTSNEVISETTLKKAFKEVWESRQNLIAEQWVRGADQVGYWKVLFDQLKSSGIGVQWQVANDPVKSTFMYWGPWVIWKDTNKNGGWPISFSGADKRLWLFKFPGGKYAGQPANNINLESKFINATFNLAQWGKTTGAVGGPEFLKLSKSKPKSGGSAACKTADGKPIAANQIPAVAADIFKELAYAFDGAGTYEAEAVAAYGRITCKQILDAVNAKVLARGMSGIKNVGDWAKDEMSDYDYGQYRKIWTGLQKLGYKAPPVSQTMRAAGVVGDVTGLNAYEKAAEGVQQLFSRPIDGFEKLIESLRMFLGGVAGAAVTTILDFTGVGKVVSSIGWGILLVGDILVWIASGKAKIVEILLDVVNILTTGAVGKTVGSVLKPLMGTGTKLGGVIAKISKFKWFKGIMDLIKSGVSKIGGMISKAIKWLTTTSWWKYLAKSKIGTAINSVANTVSKFIDDFVIAAGAGSTVASERGKAYIQKKASQKLKTNLTSDLTSDLGWAGAEAVGQDVGGETGGKVVKFAKLGYTGGGGIQGMQGANKKIDLQRSGKLSGQGDIGSDIGKLSSVSATTAKSVGGATKGLVKSVDTTAKTAGVDVNKIATDAEQKRRKEAAAAEQKRLASIKDRQNNLNAQQPLNRDVETTNVAR